MAAACIVANQKKDVKSIEHYILQATGPVDAYLGRTWRLLANGEYAPNDA